MKDIKFFISQFSEQFDETDTSLITSGTKFRELDEWSSMTALSVIAMIDEEFDIKVTGEDIRNSTTVQDIYNIILHKEDKTK